MTLETTLLYVERVEVPVNDPFWFLSHFKEFAKTHAGGQAKLIKPFYLGLFPVVRLGGRVSGSLLGFSVRDEVDLNPGPCGEIPCDDPGKVDGVINGSMEFDNENLSPTFKFRSGVPGSSFAVQIADKLGK